MRDIPIDQEILRLEVTMQHTSGVAKLHARQQLPEIALDERRRQHSFDRVHVALEVLVEIFENQIQLVRLLASNVHDIEEAGKKESHRVG